MIESFTMWRVKDREFTDYEEAVRYNNTITAAISDIEFFNSDGQPLTFEQVQEEGFETFDFVHIKSEEALLHFEKCFEDFGLVTESLTVGWNRYDYADFVWKSFAEEKRAFEKNWEKVRERIEEE